jgi:hypothetical protein
LIVPLRGERHQGARENLWNVRKPSANLRTKCANLRTKCAPEIEIQIQIQIEFFPSIDFLEIANVGKSISAEPGFGVIHGAGTRCSSLDGSDPGRDSSSNTHRAGLPL